VSTEDSGIRDDVSAETNPAEEQAPADRPAARPADGAAKARWVDYVVHLGADRGFVLGETEHHNAETGESEQGRALTREQLAELADRLGG